MWLVFFLILIAATLGIAISVVYTERPCKAKTCPSSTPAPM